MKRIGLFAYLIVFLGCQPVSTYIQKQDIQGVAVEIWIDTRNHNMNTITIRQIDGSFFYLNDVDYPGSWEYIKKGDSIIKKKGELDMHVIRNEKDSVFHFDTSSFGYKLF